MIGRFIGWTGAAATGTFKANSAAMQMNRRKQFPSSEGARKGTRKRRKLRKLVGAVGLLIRLWWTRTLFRFGFIHAAAGVAFRGTFLERLREFVNDD